MVDNTITDMRKTIDMRNAIEQIKMDANILRAIEECSSSWSVIDIIDIVESEIPSITLDCNDTDTLGELLSFFNEGL